MVVLDAVAVNHESRYHSDRVRQILADHLLDIVDETMQLDHISLWLRQDDRARFAVEAT